MEEVLASLDGFSITDEQPDSVAWNLILRRRVRSSLLDWCTFIEHKKGQTPARHHRLIIELLEKVSRGEVKNIIILMPPGSAKSTYVSVDFPPWYLAQHPTHLFLSCSCNHDLARTFGGQCRNIINEYKTELGYSLRTDSTAADDWHITTGGGYRCAGVGSDIAGRRADIGLIDDYIGNQQDADSQIVRDGQWRWYWSDFWPRLKPEAAQFIIANRRHEDDLVGRLLKKQPDRWTVIRLPYFAEENDPLGRPKGVYWDAGREEMVYNVGSRLWPEYFGEEHAKSVLILKSEDPRGFAGLYQQRPEPEEGSFFRRNMLLPYSLDDLSRAMERGLRYYVGADYAVRNREDADRFCFLVGGLDQEDRLWILPNWFWQNSDTLEATDAMIAMAKKWRPLCWWAGRESITGAIKPFLEKRMREENRYVPIEELSESKDKVAKAQAIKGRMSQKMVLFPTFAPQWEEAQREILSFPGGAYDDFVDSLAKLGQGLADMVRPSFPPMDPLDIADYKFRPTLAWMKETTRRRVISKRAFELDK